MLSSLFELSLQRPHDPFLYVIRDAGGQVRRRASLINACFEEDRIPAVRVRAEDIRLWVICGNVSARNGSRPLLKGWKVSSSLQGDARRSTLTSYHVYVEWLIPLLAKIDEMPPEHVLGELVCRLERLPELDITNVHARRSLVI
jgi:hypothetical protein